MAIITVIGEVNRTFYNDKGASIKETFTKRDGTEGASYYTAFFEQEHGLNEGDYIKISGLHSAKTSEYEDKKSGETRTGVDIVMNSPRFEHVSREDSGSSDDDSDTPF